MSRGSGGSTIALPVATAVPAGRCAPVANGHHGAIADPPSRRGSARAGAQRVEELVAAASAPREQQPRVAVEPVGEQIQHSGDVLTRVFPIGTTTASVERRPGGREQLDRRVAEHVFEIGRHLAREQAGDEPHSRRECGVDTRPLL